MTQFLRDPIWTFIGVILALATIAITIWIFWLQRKTKELAIGLLSERRPLSIADEVSSRVTVLLDGKSVKNIRFLVFAVKNSGHIPVSPSDFERAISIYFEGGEIISAQITHQSPQNINAQLLTSIDSLELRPTLLNSGAEILIQVLLSSEKLEWTLDARINGVSMVAPITTIPKLPKFFESGLPLAIVTMVIFGFGAALHSEWKPMSNVYFIGAFSILLFGYFSRVLQDVGPKARRRTSRV